MEHDETDETRRQLVEKYRRRLTMELRLRPTPTATVWCRIDDPSALINVNFDGLHSEENFEQHFRDLKSLLDFD